MAICTGCCPWNLPLMIRAVHVAPGEYAPLRFEQWMVYQLHVGMHQAGYWAGEIEDIALKLKGDPMLRIA